MVLRSVVCRSLATVAVLMLALVIGTAGAAADAGSQSVAYQLDPGHDGFASGVSLAPPLTRAWSQTLSGDVSYPVIAGGRVFVTAAASNGTNVYALNQSTGAILWQKPIGSTYAWSGIAYDVLNGVARLFVINNDGLLTAVDPGTGTSLWSFQLPGQYQFSSPPTASGGIVYDGGAGSGGTVYANDESTGALIWSQPVANGDNSSPAVDGSNVYVTYPDNYYAFNRQTGAPVWHDYLDGDGGGGRTPVVADGHLFVRDWAASPLVVSSATGASQGPLGSTTAPAIAGGTAYEMSNATLQAVTGDGLGTVRWSFVGDGHLTSAPVVTSNAAWVGSSSGAIYAVSCTTGQPLWSTNVGGPVNAPDEQNVSQPLTGLGVGGNTLVVPAGTTLVAYTSAGTSGAGACGPYNPPASSGAAGTAAPSTSAGTTKPTLQTREAALMRSELLLHTTVRHLLAQGTITVRITALAAGRLAFAWALAPVGQKTRHPLLIALGVRIKRAGSGRLVVRFKPVAVRMLRRARRGLRVAGAARFVPTHAPKVTVKRSFVVRH
jgi:outer membrane protein assembly factor BamB